MPEMWQEHPDLANRLTSDWKENSVNYDHTRQVVAMFTIVYSFGLSMSCQSGLLAVVMVGRTLSSIMGYFSNNDAPLMQFLRSNGLGLLILMLNMVALLFGF